MKTFRKDSEDQVADRQQKIKRSAISSLKQRNYRLYFIGQIISNAGTWMQMVAQSWLVLQISKSGSILGVVSAVQFLPMLFLGPLAGVYTDRYNKRKLLILTQSLFGVVALVLGILDLSGVIQLWMIFVSAALMGVINTIDMPTRQAFVIELVGREDLQNAVSLNTVVMNGARVVGPSIAGGIIYAFGVGPNFILNAVSYIAVIIVLLKLDMTKLRPATRIAAKKGQLREGFRYVMSHSELAIPLLMMVIVGTLAYEFQISIPLLATATFHKGAGSYAILTASLGFGAVIGGFLSAKYAKVSQQLLNTAAAIFGLMMLGMAAAPSYALELVVTAATGAISILFLSTANTLLQIKAREEMRGRVMALYGVAFLGSTPVGAPLIGFISQHFGGRIGILVGGVATILAAAFGTYRARRMTIKQLEPLA
ncbi:MAG: MFS transporter [Actinomycetota bacterium]|nr:MFS transporter [Actinomycetota bacterium]